MKINDILVEFAAGSGGSGGNYLKALASAWYNGTFNTGDLHKGIKSQEDVERILERGIHCGDGKVRKYSIGYNAGFDGVEIQSDDHYEHADTDDAGRDIDSRTGQPWGPYDVVEFSDEELGEDMSEGKKKAKKKSSRSQGYFFPGYGYYGSGESGEGGGDGGGESKNRGTAEGELGAVVGSALGTMAGSSSGPIGSAVGAHYGAKAGNAVTGNDNDDELAEGPYVTANEKGVGGTAAYGIGGLNDKRNMRAKNPEIQNDLQSFKSWINGGPKPANLVDMLTGVDVYFTNVEIPSDARVATALDQVLRAKAFNPQQVQILNPAVDVAIKAPIRNSASGQQNYLHPNQAPQQAQTQTVAIPVPVPGQPQQAAQAPRPGAAPAAAAPAGKKFNTTGATTVNPRPVTRPALPMPRLRERDMGEGDRKPEPPEADYGDDYQDMVKRVKKLAGLGPLKTQYDPARRVYRNMPTAVQPKK